MELIRKQVVSLFLFTPRPCLLFLAWNSHALRGGHDRGRDVNIELAGLVHPHSFHMYPTTSSTPFRPPVIKYGFGSVFPIVKTPLFMNMLMPSIDTQELVQENP